MSKLLPLIAASAVGLGVLPPVAEAVTIGTLPPVTTQVVNNGPGNQTDPHVSGDLVTYTSDDSPASTNTHVHHHDLVTGADAAVPNLGAMDFLSDIFGGTTVFTRVDGLESAIFAVGGGIGPVEVAPEASASHRRAPAIGGGIVAFQDFSFTGSSIEPEAWGRQPVPAVPGRLTPSPAQKARSGALTRATG